MKIVLTGSLGHISKPLAQKLIQQQHSVTIISSNAEKAEDIEALGAKAAIGSIEDATFLTSTFQGADIVYCMEPPINFFEHKFDIEKYWTNIAYSYIEAIQNTGVKKVIHLSSIGGHTDKGVGMLATHHVVENIFQQLPKAVVIKFMRPVGFYYNMLAFIPIIKFQSAIIQNYGGDNREPWVSPSDIADAIAEEMEQPFVGRTVRYIASDELSPNEVAKILGEAIGKPELQWKVIADEDFLNNLVSIGMNPNSAKGLVEMNAGRLNALYEDYNKHRPALGKIKLTDFAKDFAKAYHL